MQIISVAFIYGQILPFTMQISKIKGAVSDFKKGRFLIVIDGKDREDEADLGLAAEKATPEKINFMIKQAGGLICVPMSGKRLDELRIPLMTRNNTEYTKCAFTMPVDYKKGTTTGISAFDRAKTIKMLSDNKTKAGDFAKPGHVFPIRAEEKGLKKRKGHTEASIELCRLAKLNEAAVICEIIGKNGKMARMPEIKAFAKKHNIKIIMIRDLIRHIH